MFCCYTVWNNIASSVYINRPPTLCRFVWLNPWCLGGCAGTEHLQVTLILWTHHMSHTHLVFGMAYRKVSTDRQHNTFSELPDSPAWDDWGLKGQKKVEHPSEWKWSSIAQVLNLAEPCWWWMQCNVCLLQRFCFSRSWTLFVEKSGRMLSRDQHVDRLID